MVLRQEAEARLLILDYDGVCFDRSGDGTGHIDPTASDVIREAQTAGLTVAVLSNELDDHTLATTPLLHAVDHVVNCSSGVQKPDRRAFQRVMRLARAEASETVVVDDSIDSVRGATAAGAVASHFDVSDRPASWAAVRRAAGLTAASD